MSSTPDEGNSFAAEIAKFNAQLQNQKEKIIKDRLKALKKLHILKDIKTRRFKKLLIEDYSNCQKVYIDNGTHDGLLIVTFLKPKEGELTDGEFKFQLKYY